VLESRQRTRPSTRSAGEAGGVGIIARAACILRVLESADQGLSLSQLADRAGLPRSTVHRLATALQAEGFVAGVSPGGRIRLGAGLVRIARAGSLDQLARLRPLLEEVHERLHETVDLSVLEGDHARFIDQIMSPHPLRVVSGVGETLPLHCAANGRMLLALLTPHEREALLPQRLQAFTPRTVTGRAAVLAAVESAAETGVAFTYEEVTIGICGAAIAFEDPAGGPTSISVAAPTARFVGRESELAFALLDVRRRLETLSS
jgi:DNA-binding IclR family transcriptional regulator